MAVVQGTVSSADDDKKKTKEPKAPNIDVVVSAKRTNSYEVRHHETNYDPNTVTDKGIQVTPHRARDLLKPVAPDIGRRLVQTRPAEAVIALAVSDRATHLDPSLTRTSPALAAELLISPTPTNKLGRVSKDLYDAEMVIQQRAGNHPLRIAYENASLVTNVEDREQVLEYLDVVSTLPGDVRERVFADLAAGEDPMEVLRRHGAEVTEDGQEDAWAGGFWSDLLHVGTNILSGAGMVLGGGAKLFLRGLGAPAELAEVVVIKGAEAAQYGGRAVTGTVGFGLAVATGTTTLDEQNWEEQNLLEAETWRNLWDEYAEYVPTWGEPERWGGETRALFALNGDTPDEHPVLADAAQLLIDLAGPEAAIAALRSIKFTRTATRIGGGTLDGAGFMGTKAGTRVADKLLRDIHKLPEGATPESIAAVLTDRYRNMDIGLARRIVEAADEGIPGIKRVIADQVDAIPQQVIRQSNRELRRVNSELAKVSDEVEVATVAAPEPTVMRTQGDIGQIGMDDGSYVYRIDRAEVHQGYRTTGADPSMSSTGKVYFSDDPYKTYDLSDRVTGQGLGGTDFNIYRAKRDLTRMEQPGEFVSDTAIGPRDIEVFTPDGWKVLEGDVPVQSIATKVDTETLLARKTELEATIQDMASRTPQWLFPRKADLQTFMRGAFVGRGMPTRVARRFHALFGESARWNIGKLFDDAATHDMNFFNPVAVGKPADAMVHNLEMLRKVGRMAGMKTPRIRLLAEEMLKVDSRQAFYRWRVSFADEMKYAFTRGGKRQLTETMEKALEFSRRDSVEAIGTPIMGREGVRNVMRYPDGTPAPGMPSHLADHLSIGDIDLIRQARSSLHYLDEVGRNNPNFGGVYSALLSGPVRFARFATLTLPRYIFKPALLVARILPMGLKIQIDQGLRNYLMGYKPASWKKVDYAPAGIPIEDGIRAMVPEGDLTAMGMVSEDVARTFDTETMIVPTRGLNPLASRNVRLVDDILDTEFDYLVELSNDPAATMVAARGAQGTLDYINARNPGWYDDFRQVLDDTGTSAEEWLIDLEQHIDEVTGGVPDLRRAIATRKLESPNAAPQLADEVAAVEHELITIRQEAASSYDDIIHRTELNTRAELVESQLTTLRRQVRGSGKTIKLTDKKAVKAYVKERWGNGGFRMPEQFRVKRKMVFGSAKKGSKELFQDMSTLVYRRLRPLSKVDAKLTRGSLYRQVHSEVFHRLVESGYDRATAWKIAGERSAYITKDLHYDIAGRSSFDRATRDLFWFGPVIREQLTTYLYKIPSRSYLAPTLALRAGQVNSFIDGLKNLGILGTQPKYNYSTEEVETELVVRVPWVSNFISNITNSSEGGGFAVETINPITPAGQGFVPSLSPGGEAILDLTAQQMPEEFGGFFEFFAKTFTFDEDYEAFGWRNVTPYPFAVAAELFGLNLPWDGFSIEAINNENRKARVQSLRWAQADLEADGIHPPKPEKWLGEWQFNKDEVKEYNALVEERAGKYETGLKFIHLFNSIINPFPVRLEDTDVGMAYYAARDVFYAENPAASDDAYFAWRDSYSAEHPEAWPYLIGTREYDWDKDLTQEENLAAYRKAPTIEVGEYVDKALQSYAWLLEDTSGPDAVTATEKPEEFEAKPELVKQRDIAAWAFNQAGDVDDSRIGTAIGVTALESGALDQLKFPKFEGREKLLQDVRKIYMQYDNQYSSDLDQDQKDQLARVRDYRLDQVASRYGGEGHEVVNLIRSTPAERLRHARYFGTPTSRQAIRRAQSIWDHAESVGMSPQGAAETGDIVGLKAQFYNQVETWRKKNPQFDREMSRIELAIGGKNDIATSVAVYEYLYFGASTNYFGYQNAIVEAMR